MTGKSIQHWFFYICLAALTFVAFEPVRRNAFVKYDDDVYVTANFNVQQGFTCQSIRWAFATNHASNWHPLTWLSHMLDCRLFGLKPLGHHLSSLAIHIANTLLLFWLLREMTGALWRSAFVAAAFAVHPLHVESVAWVAEHKDVLSGLFWMLTIAAYIRYVKRPGAARYIAAVVIFALGLMAKPMLVTLPFVLLLLDYWPLERIGLSVQKGHARRLVVELSRLAVEKVPFFVLAAVSSVITYVVQQGGGAMEFGRNIPAGWRFANAFSAYVGYIGKMIWPAGLAVLYLYPGQPSWSKPLLSFFLLAAISAAVYAARRHRYLVTGWLLFLGTLVPVIGLVQVGVQTVADRYTYLPSIGIFIIAAWGTAELLGRLKHPDYIRIISGLLGAAVPMGLLGVWVFGTRAQVRIWQNGLTLFSHAVEVTENNFDMHRHLGDELFRQKRVDEAIKHYQKAIELQPSYYGARASIAKGFAKQGRFAEAFQQLAMALELKPDWVEAYNGFGYVYFLQGDLAQAVASWKKALEIDPDFADAANNLAWAAATRQQPGVGNPQEALQLALQACKLTGYMQPPYLDTLAAAYAASGDFARAVETAGRAARLAAAAGEKEFSSQFESRLKLYKAGQPYIEYAPSRDAR